MANGAFTLQGFESPEEVQARIGKAQEASFMPQGDINAMIYKTAAQGAAGIGGALAQGLGYEDPMIAKAKSRQLILQDTDFTDPQSLRNAISKAGDDVDLKVRLASMHQAIQKEVPPTKYDTTRINRDGIEETWITKNGIPMTRIAESKLKEGGVSIDFGDKESVKYSFDQLKDASLDSKVADLTLANLDKMEQLIGHVDTSALTPLKVTLSQIGTALGIDVPKDVKDLEAANAVAGDLVMGVLSKFKGAISNEERKFAGSIMPKLSQTKEGRAKIIEYLKAISERARVKKNMMTKFIQTHGKQLIPDEGETFDDQWNKYTNDNPVFPEMSVKSAKRKRLEELRAKRDSQ